MKKIVSIAALVLVGGVAFALEGFVLKNTGNSTVFSVAYESGEATNTVDGVIVADSIVSKAASAVAVGSNEAVAVSGSFIQLSPTAAITNATLSAVAPAKIGQSVTIVNVGTNSITFLDSGAAKLSANIALGQYDSLSLIIQDTNALVQTSTSNN